MSAWRRTLKVIHVSSTVLFMLSVGMVLIVALAAEGAPWWLILGLTGPSAAFVFVLISVYLFAVFRGAVRHEHDEIEHPLTRSSTYMAFYDGSPFIGFVAGIIAWFGVGDVMEYLLGVSYGTLATTFLVWILIDPALSFLEMLLPESRRHRQARLARAKAQREERQEERDRLLADLQDQDALKRERWAELLGPQAKQLSGLVAGNEVESQQAKREAVDIGVQAWQMGGLSCMQQLFAMVAFDVDQAEEGNGPECDKLAGWWEGIGNWRRESMGASTAR